VLVEFANSYNSTYPDDKAGDLFVLEQALQGCCPAGLVGQVQPWAWQSRAVLWRHDWHN